MSKTRKVEFYLGMVDYTWKVVTMDIPAKYSMNYVEKNAYDVWAECGGDTLCEDYAFVGLYYYPSGW